MKNKIEYLKEDFTLMTRGDAWTPKRFWELKVIRNEDLAEYRCHGWVIADNQDFNLDQFGG